MNEMVETRDLTPEQKNLYAMVVARNEQVFQVENTISSDSDDDSQLTIDQVRVEGLTEEAHALQAIKTMGTKSLKAAYLLMENISNFGINGSGKKLDNVNAMLSIIHDIEPRDDIEAMLVSQMITTHMLSMSRASSANNNENNINIADKIINQMTKLNRSYLAQMDALNKHRGKGQQKMTVEHVHVNEGGQAIIGNVDNGKNQEGTGGE